MLLGKVDGVDKDGGNRKIIQFSLIPVRSFVIDDDNEDAEESIESEDSLDDLRKAAYAASKSEKININRSIKTLWRQRSKNVKDYVLARADGFCEACGEKAPFFKKDGTPYLEPHHTKRLADEGPDHPAWVGAICPTCHRRIHSGIDGEEWNKKLQIRLDAKENAF